MGLFNKIWRSNFLIKLRSWEYWPFGVVYAPVFVYWIWLSLKARSLLYFTASNPGIENGGMLGESKKKILDLIPANLQPKYALIMPEMAIEKVIDLIKNQSISYPFICKPDIGERGWMVRKINNQSELEAYCREINVEFLVQDYVDAPIEMGVFYYRYPGKNKGRVSSIVLKEMLAITGDGKSTIKTLILNSDRAKLQWDVLKEKYAHRLDEILKKDEPLQLVGIGNHCKGAKFLNGNNLINEKLHAVFDKISNHVNGFYFGRYDIRIKTLEDLYNGNIMIMELNGAGSEPAHIYQPNYSLWEAYKVIFHHWKVLYEISVLNNKNGIPYLTFVSGWKEYQKSRNVG